VFDLRKEHADMPVPLAEMAPRSFVTRISARWELRRVSLQCCACNHTQERYGAVVQESNKGRVVPKKTAADLRAEFEGGGGGGGEF